MSAAFLTFLGGIIAASITAVYQIFSQYNARREHEVDRKIALRNLRREAYMRYLTSYRKLAFLPPSLSRLEEAQAQVAAHEEYWGAYSDLFPLASEAVLLAAANFHELAWAGDTDLTGEAYHQKFKEVYATLILEIREEVYDATQLRSDIVEERLPWYYEDVNQ